MNDKPRRKSGSRLLKRVLLGIPIAFVSFIAFDFDWTGRGAPPPATNLHYDGYTWPVTSTRYLRALGLDLEDVPPDENAALDYLIAAELLPGQLADREAQNLADDQGRYVTQYGWAEECSLLWSYVNGAQPAIDRARMGLAKAQALWPIQMGSDMLVEASLPGSSHARQLGRVFILRGRYAAWKGNDEEALESFLAPIQIGNHLASGLSPMHGLVGLAVNEMGFNALERWILSGPPEPLLRRALKEVRALESRKPDQAHVVRCNRAEAMDYVRFYGKLPKDELFGERRLLAVEGPILGRSRTLRGIARRKANAVFDRIEQFVALKGRARHAALPGLDRAIDEASKDRYTRVLTAFFLLMGYGRYALNEVRYAALEVRIGLALYKAEHGRYPEALDDIEPFLGKVPLDPLTEEPFRYRLEGDEYVFYSLGPDMTDEGGTDARTDKANFNECYRGNLKDIVFPSYLAPPPSDEDFMKPKSGTRR